MTDYARIALALNNVATTLQQLAVELDSTARTARVPPAGQLDMADLRAQLARPVAMPTLEERMTAVQSRLASVAEPECGCSLYTRCEAHSVEKRCKCNGPGYRSSACLIEAHRDAARSMPDLDPALLD